MIDQSQQPLMITPHKLLVSTQVSTQAPSEELSNSIPLQANQIHHISFI